MDDYRTNDIRNIALIGHAGSGKTTISEAILYNAGASSRFGKVDDGTTVSDYNEDEKERKISISASILSFNYANKHINMIDTPGYADFFGEVLGPLNGVDNAIVVIDAVEGVQVGTEKVWNESDSLKLPRAIFINKMDKENVDFNKTVTSIRERFGKRCIVGTMPLCSGANFKGVVYLLDKKGLDSLKEGDKDNGFKLRDTLIEAIAENKDELLEKYLEGKELTQDEIMKGFKEGIMENKIFPIFCGVGPSNIGIKELIIAIDEIFPSPSEITHIKVKDVIKKEDKELTPDIKAPFVGRVFKTIADPYVGQLTVFRVFSGLLKSDSSFYNSTRQSKEKFGTLLSIFGKEQRSIQSACAGDIVAVAKLKNTGTGDSICSEEGQVLFEDLIFPEPAISFSVKPKTRADEDKISITLQKLTNEDLTFTAKRDSQTKELIVSGMGDLHLDIMIKRLRKRFSVDVEIGIPKVAYKETVKKMSKTQGKYKRQTGGHGQYGDVWIQVEPLERGKGFEFVDKIVGGVIPKNYIPSVEKGVVEAMSQGVIAGYQMVDIRVTLYDGSYHEVDSSDIAFKIAGSMALRKSVLEAGPVLLEPIMDVDVVVSDEFMGDVTGDLNSRRGRIVGMDVQGKNQVVKANVPIAEMFKYASELRSMTGGRGSYSMRFSHYDEVPHKIAETIIAKYEAGKNEEEDK